MKKGTRNLIIAVVAVLALAAAMLLCWQLLGRQSTSVGDKTITVEVTHEDGTVKELTLTTDAEYLWDAMTENGCIDGTDSEYGKWVTTVDGETADEASGHYWVFTQNGEWVETSCDATPIADGQHYEFYIYVS